MRTNVYIDGFNLYYRLLKDNPSLKWLDLRALSVQLLQPAGAPHLTLSGVAYEGSDLRTARTGQLSQASPSPLCRQILSEPETALLT